MGHSLSWLAVKGKRPRDLHRELGVERTGEREDLPESPIVGAALPGGWYVVVFNEADVDLSDEVLLARVSAGCEIVTCDVEEHVMFSAASGWKDGEERWSVFYDSQVGIEHLATKGELPAAFRSIADEARNEQDAAGGERAEVDFLFDVPLELARTLTRFRHDEELEGTEPAPFEQLDGL